MEPATQVLTVRPGFLRFLLAEMRAVLVLLAIEATLFMVFRRPLLVVTMTGACVGVVVVAVMRAVFSRERMRLTIDPTGVRGPCRDSAYSTFVRFDEMDWERSGIRRRQLRFVPRQGEPIRIQLVHYSADQLESIRRALRERVDAANLPESFRYEGVPG